MRQARLAAGLSLADIAGGEVSRTQIHFIEHGRSRPSRRVLDLIAERTGKPVSYFLLPGAEVRRPSPEETISNQLKTAATQVGRLGASSKLTRSEREAMKLVEVTLRQAAVFVRSVEPKAE